MNKNYFMLVAVLCLSTTVVIQGGAFSTTPQGSWIKPRIGMKMPQKQPMIGAQRLGYPGEAPQETPALELQILPPSQQTMRGFIKTEPVENGASFTLTLPENRSTGYMWYVTKTKNITEIGDTYKKAVDGMPGQGGQRVFVFKAQLSDLSPTNNAELILVQQRAMARTMPKNITLGTESNDKTKKYLIPIATSR